MSVDADLQTWRKAKRIFDRLANFPQERWQERVQRMRLDAAVRERIYQLFGAHQRTVGILDNPLTTAPLPLGLVGRRLGQWTLEAALGHGGSAVVYRARAIQHGAERVAAVKLLTLASLGRSMLDRFQQEQRILARLNHPHIAQLFDFGHAEDGTPWLAMALVDGTPIDAWCRSRAMRPRSIVELYLSVCDAVAYAHRNLVIHRDIKPSNVLIDEHGHVRLLDFGIARLLDDESPATETRWRALTPQYAAPEQFTGASPTTAIDVFGLGALLYRLLTGEVPKRSSPAELESPTPPSAIHGEDGASPAARREMRGDLDRVVLKALAAQPEARYASVAEFAADLKRWLAGEPVTAAKPSFGYRTRKFVARNRVPVAAVAGVLLALTGGVITTSWQARRALEKAQEAQAESQRANTVSDFLLDLFKASDPDAAGGEKPDLLAILARGAAKAQQADAMPLRARAALLSALGGIYSNLGRYDEGERLLDQSIALWKTDPGPPSPLRYEPRLQRAAMLQVRGQTRAALAEAQALVEEMRRDAVIDKALLGKALIRLGEARITAGSTDAAAKREAVEAITLARANTAPDAQQEGDAVHILAMMQRRDGEFATAEHSAREAIELYQRGGREARHALRAAWFTLGSILSDQGRHADALGPMAQGVALTREIYAQDHVFVARALNSIATELHTVGRLREARSALEEAYSIYKRSGANEMRLAPILFNLATMSEDEGDAGAAVAQYQQALDLQQTALGESDEHVWLIKARLGDLRERLGQSALSEQLFASIEPQIARSAAADMKTRAQVLTRLARHKAVRGQAEAALNTLHQIDMSENNPALANFIPFRAALIEAQALWQLQRNQEAKSAFAHALRLLRETEPAQRYAADEFTLDAVDLALDHGLRAEAAELFALGESARIGHEIIPRLAQQHQRLRTKLGEG